MKQEVLISKYAWPASAVSPQAQKLSISNSLFSKFAALATRHIIEK